MKREISENNAYAAEELRATLASDKVSAHNSTTAQKLYPWDSFKATANKEQQGLVSHVAIKHRVDLQIFWDKCSASQKWNFLEDVSRYTWRKTNSVLQ